MIQARHQSATDVRLRGQPGPVIPTDFRRIENVGGNGAGTKPWDLIVDDAEGQGVGHNASLSPPFAKFGGVGLPSYKAVTGAELSNCLQVQSGLQTNPEKCTTAVDSGQQAIAPKT